MMSNGNTQPVGILDQFENVLKLVTGAVGLVAAIGFPAVAVHLVSFGVPVGRADYDFILRAGVLPALVLIVMVAYAYAASRVVAHAGVGGLLTAHLLPVFVPILLVLFAGLFAYVVLFIWGVLWSLVWMLHGWKGVSIGNRTLLLIAGALVTALYGIYGLLFVTRRFWADRPGRSWRVLGQIVDSMDSGEARVRRERARTGVAQVPGTSSPSTSEATSTPAKNESSSWEWVIGLAFIPVSLLVLYSIKGVMYVWEPSWGALLPHRYIIYASILLGVLFTLLMLGVSTLDHANAAAAGKPKGPSWAMVVTVALAYVIFEVSYCWWGYPCLYAGLGGGRPTPVTIWLKSDDGVADILALLASAKETTIAGAKRLDGVFVLFDNTEGIVLTDTSAAPGRTIFIPHDRVTALSW
jgi:hypothetical protein